MGVGQPAISAPGIGVSAQRSRGVAIAIVNAQRWTTYVAAILLPLTVWPLTYDHYVLPKLLAARLVVLLLAFLFIARVVITGSVQIKRTPLDIPLLAFVWSAALSTIFSVNANVALFGTYSRYDGLLTLVTYAALFWLVVQSLSQERDTTTLLRSLLIGAYIVSVVAIVRWCADALTGQPDPRAYGTLGNANVLGAYLVLLIPAAYAELRQATSTAARLLSANALITLTLALLLSVSHSAWLGLAVAAAVLLVGRQVPLPRSLPRLALMVVGAAATAIGVLASGVVNNRVVAYVLGLALIGWVWYSTFVAGSFSGTARIDFLDYVSAFNRYQSFSLGQLTLRDAVYFASLTLGALVLATPLLRSKR